MKSIFLVFTVFLLGGMIFAPTPQEHVAYAVIDDAPKITKKNVLDTISNLDVDNKKDKKRIDKLKKELEKSLDEKLWIDDFTLSLLGQKVFSHDKKVINELTKVKSVDVSELILSLIKSDETLAQLAIDSVPIDTGVKKINKKLAKAIDEMSKAQKNLDENKIDKAIDHFKKAWKLAKMGEGIEVPETDSGGIDINSDGLPDYYVQTILSTHPKKPIQLNYKIQNECADLGPKDPSDVGGDTYDDAAMLIGVSTLNREWITQDIKVWNDWFKHNDDNKIVDLIYWDSPFLPKFKFLSGDNVIQGNSDDASFKQFSSIDQLGGQSGWSGSLFFNAPSGDYLFWTIHPAGGTEECDTLSGVGIHLTIP